ncbi:hypothetical protein [Streptomyces hoynatensis]|uniref:hypothetical protein n=1 Tax=Streptomyces hoynatensis TaxID=1141874 RepID=UPI0011C3F903|nr:hypothetical protein [Streptomyces hoynatensis]
MSATETSGRGRPSRGRAGRLRRRLAASGIASVLVLMGATDASAAAGAQASGWQETPVPLPSPDVTSANLLGVGGGGGANSTWATGFFIPSTGPFAPMAVRWDGSGWVQTPVPVEQPDDPTLRLLSSRLDGGIAEVAPDDVWAVGDTGTYSAAQGPVAYALIEHWNGTSWQQTPTDALPAGSKLFGIAAVSATDIWAGGEIAGSAGLAHWNGRAWTPVTPAALSDANPVSWVNSLSAAGPGDVWAVGPVGVSIHYDGHTWRKVPLPDLGGDEAWLQNVRTDARFGTWAVGYRVGPDGIRNPLALRWTGTAWESVPVPAAADTQLQDVAFTRSGPQAFGYTDSQTTAAAYGVQLPTTASGQARPITMPAVSDSINGAVSEPGGAGVWIVGTAFARTSPDMLPPFAARTAP